MAPQYVQPVALPFRQDSIVILRASESIGQSPATRSGWLPAAFVLLSLCACYRQQTNQPAVEAYFSPHGGCTAAVIRELNSAKDAVLVQAYSFTSAPIAQALVAAHRRGVDVRVILDKSQRTQRYSSATFLAHAGVQVLIDVAHAIAHNKTMVIDRKVVLTGSFNFTRAAEEKNAENLLIIRDGGLAKKYAENWQRHAKHSMPYQGIAAQEHKGRKEPESLRSMRSRAAIPRHSHNHPRPISWADIHRAMWLQQVWYAAHVPPTIKG